MNKTKGGIMPAAMTIWNADETINVKGQEMYLRWLIDNGADNLSIVGSTGENIAYTMDEAKQMYQLAARLCRRRGAVYAGTGRYATRQTIELTKAARRGQAATARW